MEVTFNGVIAPKKNFNLKIPNFILYHDPGYHLIYCTSDIKKIGSTKKIEYGIAATEADLKWTRTILLQRTRSFTLLVHFIYPLPFLSIFFLPHDILAYKYLKISMTLLIVNILSVNTLYKLIKLTPSIGTVIHPIGSVLLQMENLGVILVIIWLAMLLGSTVFLLVMKLEKFYTFINGKGRRLGYSNK